MGIKDLLNVDGHIINVIDDLKIDKSGVYYFVYKQTKQLINVVINDGLDVKIYELYEGSNLKVNYEIKNNCYVDLNSINENKHLDKVSNYNLGLKSILKVYILDLGHYSNYNYNLDLNREESKVLFNLMTYANLRNEKNYSLNINHLKKKTNSIINNYAILDQEALCKFIVTNFVKKDSFLVDTEQTSKIITLSDNCIGELSPNLLVDECNVQAKHKATYSKIDEEILYYFNSRGIDKERASALICVSTLLKDASRDLIPILITKIEKRLANEKIS